MEALEGQAYLELVCFKCPTYPECEGSNMEDCQRADIEIEEAKIDMLQGERNKDDN
jgi:hypothetical protein